MSEKKKVLFITHDEMLLDLLRHATRDDYEMLSTREIGRHLKPLILKEKPDFICLDVHLPHADSIEMCVKIRQWVPDSVTGFATWGVDDYGTKKLIILSESYVVKSLSADESQEMISAS